MPVAFGQLVEGIIAGDAAAVRELLAQDATLAAVSWGYFTPLHFAVREGHRELVELLLSNGADASEQPYLSWQDSLLQKAQDRGYDEVEKLLREHLQSTLKAEPIGEKLAALIRERKMKELLRLLEQQPEAIHASDERGNTPLHWAVMTRQLELIGQLLTMGADPLAKRGDGSQPAQLALEGDYFYRANRNLPPDAGRDASFLLGYLVGKGDVPYDICLAAATGDAMRVDELLKQNSLLANEQDTSGRSPLYYAAKRGYLEVVKRLLAAGAIPNASERDAPQGAALYAAVRGGYTACAKLLLEHGADPNAEIEASGNAVYAALQEGRQELIELVYSYGGNVTLTGACALGRIDLVGELLAANHSSVDGGDYGPLAQAASCGYTAIVRLLLRHNAPLNDPWYASNYMHYACSFADADMVKLLLEGGADPNHTNWLGVSYLHLVALQGKLDLAELMIAYGASLEAVDEENRTTPLGWAAKYGKLEMVTFLLQQGAEIEPVGVPQWATPLAWAQRRGNEAIAKLLLAHRSAAV
ncbi:ankyrin repeat domain-containing protein [Paenibacillus albus]|nr:ankyrin repeat domain-containing protein [Paenibacillus albus]